MAKANKAVVAGGLAVVAIGAIALSARKARASESPPAGVPGTTAASDRSKAPTTGNVEMVEQAVSGILEALPDVTLDQFVLGSLDNALSLIDAEGPEAAFAVYEPDDLSAIYHSTYALDSSEEDRDAAAGMAVATGLVDGSGAVVIPTGRSLWLDEAHYFDADGRLDPVIDRFLASQQTSIA